MNMRNLYKIYLFHLIFSGILSGRPPLEQIFPANWTIVKTVTVPDNQLASFGQKLGGNILALKNCFLDIDGVTLQMNIINCRTPDDAVNIRKTLLGIHRSEEKCLIDGKNVYELIGQNTLYVKKARSLLGKNTVTMWQVEMELAPLGKSDDMSWNTLFNLLREYKNNNNGRTRNQILNLAKKFKFSQTLNFNNKTVDGEKPKYRINGTRQAVSGSDMTVFRINNPVYELGIPKIKVSAGIPVQGFTPYKPPHSVDVDYYTAPNPYWPAQNPKILALVGKIIKNRHTEKQKIIAIQRWVYKNIRYGGTAGSRYGTINVIEQGYGRCWDKCDVLITLCRAAGLPARQVAGWVYGQSGHIWAEVYILNQGWISLDATAAVLGVSDDYIPFFILNTGKMPAVYWDIPRIQKPASG